MITATHQDFLIEGTGLLHFTKVKTTTKPSWIERKMLSLTPKINELASHVLSLSPEDATEILKYCKAPKRIAESNYLKLAQVPDSELPQFDRIFKDYCYAFLLLVENLEEVQDSNYGFAANSHKRESEWEY